MKNAYLLVVVILWFAHGCSSARETTTKSGPNSNTTGGSKSTGTGGQTASGDPKENVIKAAKKLLELPFFTARMEGVGVNAPQMQLEYAAPDRFRISQTAGDAGGMQTVYIGDQTYIKPDDIWRKSPSGVGGTMLDMRSMFGVEGLGTLTDVKFEGEETVLDKPAFIYSYKSNTVMGSHPFTAKVWIGRDNGAPVKVSVDYSGGAVKQMTILYDTDTPVKIEPPIIK